MAFALPKVFWPLIISASNRNIAIRLTGSTQYTATIATGTYLSAESLRSAIQTAIQAVGGGAVFNTLVVTVDATGHFVITNTVGSLNFSLDWNRGGFTNSAVSLMGFFAINYDSAAEVITAPKQHSNGWYASVAVRFDSLPIRDRDADTITTALSGQNKIITENELVRREITFENLTAVKTYIAFEGNGNDVGQSIENWWADGRGRFRYWPDGTVEATFYDYVLDMPTMKKFEPERMYDHKALYRIKFGFKGYV